MHQTAFREIVRDAEIAKAILPVVRKHQLSPEATAEALVELHIPRAASIAAIARFTQ